MSRAQALEWVKERWAIISLLIFLIGALSGSKIVWGDDRLTRVEEKVRAIEAQMGVVDAIALSLCLREGNIVARAQLECGERERRAGVR